MSAGDILVPMGLLKMCGHIAALPSCHPRPSRNRVYLQPRSVWAPAGMRVTCEDKLSGCRGRPSCWSRDTRAMGTEGEVAGYVRVGPGGLLAWVLVGSWRARCMELQFWVERTTI